MTQKMYGDSADTVIRSGIYVEKSVLRLNSETLLFPYPQGEIHRSVDIRLTGMSVSVHDHNSSHNCIVLKVLPAGCLSRN